MDNLVYFGFLGAALLISWAVREVGAPGMFFNTHGLLLVLGGLLCATLVNYRFAQVRRALMTLLSVLSPRRPASAEECVAEILRLGALAREQGGLLALQDEGLEFRDAFLRRALLVAIAAGEERRAREILEAEIRQSRLLRLEDANFFRTIGTLAPMFGLLGTLLGIIIVLRNMSDPVKVGPAMALAMTASLYGIGLSNFICVPLAGHIRARSLEEARLREILMEGVLQLMRGESTYLLELRMGAYARLAEPQGGQAAGEATEP